MSPIHPPPLESFIHDEFRRILDSPKPEFDGSFLAGEVRVCGDRLMDEVPDKTKEALCWLVQMAKTLHALEGKTISGFRYTVNGEAIKLSVCTDGERSSAKPKSLRESHTTTCQRVAAALKEFEEITDASVVGDTIKLVRNPYGIESVDFTIQFTQP